MRGHGPLVGTLYLWRTIRPIHIDLIVTVVCVVYGAACSLILQEAFL